MDDLQMAYMNTEDYTNMAKVNCYNEDKKRAKLKKENPNENPKSFIENQWKDTKKEEEAKLAKIPEDKIEEAKENYKNGFIMEWTPTQLETQAYNVATYEKENVELSKPVPNEDELTDEDKLMFVDTRENAVEYESLIFDVNNYKFDDFGASTSSSGGSGNAGSSAMARSKIMEYARKAVALCKDGKAKYSSDNRSSHEGAKGTGPIDGINYWDAGTLVSEAYANAGVILSGDLPSAIFAQLKSSQGGKLILFDNINEAKEGDILICTKDKVKVSLDSIENMQNSQCTHVGIYAGNKKYIDAFEALDDSTKDIREKKLGDWTEGELCFGRPKAIIDMDKALGDSDYWTREFHNIPDDIWQSAAKVEGNAKVAIENMKKYNYKQGLIEAGKETGYDPYFIFAIAAAESNGNPLAGPYMGTAKESGIMQCSGGLTVTDPAAIKKEFIKGMNVLSAKKTYLKQHGWTEDHIGVLANAYNFGEGHIMNALGYTNSSKYGMPKIPMDSKIPAISMAVHNFANKHNIYGGDRQKIRLSYLTKILRAYRYLYDNDALGINAQMSENGFINPVSKSHRITSPYGPRKHPISGVYKTHTGVDTGSPGGYPIKASASGTVSFAGPNGGYGNFIIVKHANNKDTRYAHLSKISVSVGQQVKQGDVIGNVGTTGSSTGNHLHFEVRTNGNHENPANYISDWK